MSPIPSAASLQLPAKSEGERLRMVEMLLNVSRQVAAMETLDGILEILVEICKKETGADRGTLFLNDPSAGELYSRVAQGNSHREIRIPNTAGVAGHVFSRGKGIIIDEAYEDERFDRSVDKQTGYHTHNILCAPIRTVRGDVIGVIQTLNKAEGNFTLEDLALLEAMTTQAAITLQSTQYIEQVKQTREREMEFLDVVSDVTAELELKPLLQRVMGDARRMLRAERATLFLNDEKTQELWSEVGTGLAATQIRLPNHLGIAGAVFTHGKAINIPYAYADLRFNPDFDRRTGFFTRSILCVPVVNKQGTVIGVTQVLNKKGGPFSQEDEARLKAFSAQISIGLENAQLFEEVQRVKNYNQSVLESMSSGVLTLDAELRVITCNASGHRILRTTANDVLDKTLLEVVGEDNGWLQEKVSSVASSGEADSLVDMECVIHGRPLTANFSVQPLRGVDGKTLGTMVMIEDITTEKRIKSTLARYLDPTLADRLLDGDKDLLGGKSIEATILFCDIRNFTTLAEELGPQGTVSLLNEYFSIMVDCIQRHGGVLDKFIGDALMAAFGAPMPLERAPDRAVRAAIEMVRALEDFNASRHERGLLRIDIGIGVNTDSVVSGNIGSPKRMDYTVIGDGVNIAARLEGMCKQYGARLLVSERTLSKLAGEYATREVDRVVVKGKTQALSVHEVLDCLDDKQFPNRTTTLKHFRKGLAAYRKQEFEAACREFHEVLAHHPADRVSSLYVERCEQFIAQPPGEEWDGAWVLAHK